jgi:hypothetical protein
MRALAFLPLCCVAVAARAQTPSAWDSVARVLQTSPTPSAGYTRFNFPRRDLQVRIGDVTVAPATAMTAWVGFAGDPADAEMMGDLILVAGELRGVLAEVARQGIEVTAIHNHFAGETPTITTVHFHGHGAATALAARLDRVLARSAIPRPVATLPTPPVAIDTALVFRALGQSGRVYGVTALLGFVLVPGTVTIDGRALTPALAYASPVNVQMVSSERAVATGDFAVPGPRVNAVLTALATHDITATAVHTHLIGESPQVYFIHFWADGALPDVLAGLRSALDAAR